MNTDRFIWPLYSWSAILGHNLCIAGALRLATMQEWQREHSKLTLAREHILELQQALRKYTDREMERELYIGVKEDRPRSWSDLDDTERRMMLIDPMYSPRRRIH